MVKFKADPKLLYDMARERLQIQLAFFDVLDTKVATMYAAGSGILSLMAAVFALRPQELDRDGLTVISVAGFAYFILTVCLALSHWPRRYETGPDLKAIWNDLYQRDNDELLIDLIGDYMSYITLNDRRGWIPKPLIARIALVATAVETVALTVGLVLVAAGAEVSP